MNAFIRSSFIKPENRRLQLQSVVSDDSRGMEGWMEGWSDKRQRRTAMMTTYDQKIATLPGRTDN